jgi:hypothetical protein
MLSSSVLNHYIGPAPDRADKEHPPVVPSIRIFLPNVKNIGCEKERVKEKNREEDMRISLNILRFH